jgi:hypothetical protein
MDLAELIRSTKGDRSYDDLARDAGGTPGRQRWQQLATSPIRNFPDPPTIRSIAGALGVTQRTVVLAAAESLGLDTGTPGGLVEQLLPPGLDDLPEDEQRALLGVARVLTRRHRSGPDFVYPSPHGPAIVVGGESAELAKDEVALAAMPGTPAYAERDSTGEHSQDPGHDDPA